MSYRNYALMADMLDIDFGHDGMNRLAGFLASYAGRDGGNVYPSVRTLARRMGRDVRTVQRHLKRLRDAGLIFEVMAATQTVCYRFNLAVVRLLVNGVVDFGELVAGKVSVTPEAEPQMVLPGFEGGGLHFAGQATEMSPHGDRDVTQSKDIKTIPGALRDHDDLINKMISAAGDAVDPDMAHGLNDLSEVRQWMENGADLDLDVLPVVASRSKGKDKGSVYSWKYYRKAVLAALVRRTDVVDLADYRQRQSIKRGRQGGVAQLRDAASIVNDNRAAAVRLFEETGYWDDQFGDRPETACGSISHERCAS